MKSGVVVLASATDDGKVAIVASVTPDLKGRLHAGNIVKALAPIVGGGGGGRPDFAEAGGKDPSKIDAMLAEGRTLVEQMVRGQAPLRLPINGRPFATPSSVAPFLPIEVPERAAASHGCEHGTSGNLLAHRIFLVVAAFMAASVAVPARADVYAWKDKDGRLVVSDRPGGPGVQHATYSVRGVETIRTTRLAVGPALNRADLHALADRHAETHAINPALVRAVIQAESAWNTRAVSPKGALGLMQLMPADRDRTWRRRPV